MPPPRGLIGSSARQFEADPGEVYNTPLSDAEERAYQAWAARAGRARDVEDYDLRGAWRDGFRATSGQHGPDTYKKPNHPTFSRESIYSGPASQGGDWVKGADGRWLFFASPDNLRSRSAETLLGYFGEVEPGNRLVLPADLSGLRPAR